MAKKPETLVVKITRGFRYKGQSILPAKADEKGKVTPKIIKLEKRFALQLEAASKVEICKDQKTKTNIDLPKSDDFEDEFGVSENA